MRTPIALAVVAACSLVSLAGPLKISLPPALGAVPIAMGEVWGLFDEEGVEIEMIPLPSQRDRVLAFQAGQVDVMVSDLTAALLLVASAPREAAILAVAYAPQAGVDHLAILTPTTFSRIGTWGDLLARIRNGQRLQIALPRQSDLEFVMDSVFQEEGVVVPSDLYIGQDNLLTNASWVLGGMVAVGVLPQPYVDYIVTYGYPGKPELVALRWVPGERLPPEVIVVRRSLGERDPEALAAFLRGLRRTVERLNEAARDEIVTDALPVAVDLFFPGAGPETADPEVRAQIEAGIAAIAIPVFPAPGPLDREIYDRVMMWAVGKKYLRAPLPYDEAVVPAPG
ncbi:MAG TPA: hypothetical protein ENN53_03935 [Candidatus Acetothermia bacterium]|nr:hypothetical protein [Candidatus Acetothermia bacterium]